MTCTSHTQPLQEDEHGNARDAAVVAEQVGKAVWEGRQAGWGGWQGGVAGRVGWRAGSDCWEVGWVGRLAGWGGWQGGWRRMDLLSKECSGVIIVM